MKWRRSLCKSLKESEKTLEAYNKKIRANCVGLGSQNNNNPV